MYWKAAWLGLGLGLGLGYWKAAWLGLGLGLGLGLDRVLEGRLAPARVGVRLGHHVKDVARRPRHDRRDVDQHAAPAHARLQGCGLDRVRLQPQSRAVAASSRSRAVAGRAAPIAAEDHDGGLRPDAPSARVDIILLQL